MKQGEVAADQLSNSFVADVKGTPVDFKGDITYKAEGEDKTVASYVSEVSVNIPMMGAAIEPKVAEALGELYQNEADLTSQWIEANL